MKQKKVAIYIRVSTEEQNTAMQLSELTEYAEKREYEIFKIYEDKVSGMTKSRVALDEMLIEAKKRKFDIVLVWKFDRFARSLKMLVDSLALFQELGIDFISFKESIDTTTSMGRLLFHINSAYAEFEREIIRERTIAGLESARALGRMGGRPKGLSDVSYKTALAAKQHYDVKTLPVMEICKKLSISKPTLYKYFKYFNQK